MTFPVFRSRSTAIFTYLTSTSGSCVDAYNYNVERFRKTASTVRHIGTVSSLRETSHLERKMLLLILYYVVCANNAVYPEALP